MAGASSSNGVGEDSLPREGDAVHVVGHGPAVIVKVGHQGRHKYHVLYPNGTQYRVARDQILAHEAVREAGLLQGGPALGPRQLEYLSRAFDDSSRNLPISSATFSLVATMVGGGVLSLPYAMSQCGLVLGTVVLVVSAIASAWTLDLLVQCARCTGRDTFELVGHAAFGENSRKLTVALVFLICWLTQVAYFVLLADLLAPTSELLVPQLQAGRSEEAVRRIVVTGAGLLLAPMCFKSSLSALRFLCFASVGSVVAVGAVVGFRAAQHLGVRHEIAITLPSQEMRTVSILVEVALWPRDWAKALYVFPMFGVSFLCHFNALATHQELHMPTRQRMRRVLMLCLGFSTLLYLFVSIAGYLYAGDCTCGNILLNFRRQDPLVAFGRGALGLVLMLNFPLICQPCRNALFRLLSDGSVGPRSARCGWLTSARQPRVSSSSALGGGAAPREDVLSTAAVAETGLAHVLAEATARAPPSREMPADVPNPRHQGSLQPQETRPSPARVHAYRCEETRGMMAHGCTVQALDTFAPKEDVVQQSAAEPSTVQRFALTAVLLVSALLFSCFMKSILVVWSILGSTVAFLIAFILPAAFWRQLVGPYAPVPHRRAAEVLLGVSVVLAICCTALTCMNLSAPPCPPAPALPRVPGAAVAEWLA